MAVRISGATQIEEGRRAPSEIEDPAQDKKTLKRARLRDSVCRNGLVTGIESHRLP